MLILEPLFLYRVLISSEFDQDHSKHQGDTIMKLTSHTYNTTNMGIDTTINYKVDSLIRKVNEEETGK